MIILILFLGFIFRLINLNQSLWLDEAIEVLAVKNKSFLELVTSYPIGDFHPPFYHLVLKLWTNIFGYSEIAVRLPSVLFGVMTIAFTYLIGKRIFNAKIGLVAVFLMSINPLAVYYSQEARMYGLAALAISASVYFLISKKTLFFGIFLLVALYTDYIPWLMLPMFWRYWILGIFLLPLFPLGFLQLSTALSVANASTEWSRVVGGFAFKALPLTLVKFIIGRISVDNKLVYGLLLTPISAFYLFVLSRVKHLFLWKWFVFPLALGFLLSWVMPIFSYFRFIFVLTPFCLLLAKGVENRKVMLFVMFLVSLGSLAIFNLNTSFHRENWRGAVDYMRSEGNGLALLPSLAQVSPLSYYGWDKVQDKENLNLSGYKTVYLFRYVQEIFDSKDILRISLEDSGYKKVEEKSFNGVVLWKYQI